MADMTIVSALRRFFTKGEIEAAYKEALIAFNERSTEVVVTAASFEGGNSNGQIAGDPRALMQAAEEALSQMDAEQSCVPAAAGPTHLDLSRRRVEP